MRPKPLAALAAVAAACLAAAPAASARPTTPAPRAVAVAASAGAQARTIERLIDRIRGQHGLAPLHANARLGRAARRHSADMRSRGYFAHDGPDGTPAGRIAAAGYRRAAAVGETIAWGSGPLGRPQELVTAWMNSPPHRDTILAPAFREIGVGVARAGGQAWATADFGRRR